MDQCAYPLGYGGIIISQCDNLIRFLLQKKWQTSIRSLRFWCSCRTAYFGFMGIIFGPLLVSLFLLFLDMFRKEYLLDGTEEEEKA